MAAPRITLTQAEAQTLMRAFSVLQRGDAATAAGEAAKVLRSAPASPDAHHLLALCQQRRGDHGAALASFERALEHAPRHPAMLSNAGALLLAMGRAQEAVQKQQAALRADPNHLDAWISLAHARLALSDVNGALAAAREALKRAPKTPRALHALAAALREQGDLDGAEDALRNALALDPNSGWAWTSLGIVRRLIGDPEDSLHCYAKARALGYDTPELADAEASAHLDVGDHTRALEAAQALIAARPDYVAGHVLAAHIRWEYGVGAENDPLAALDQAAAAQPQNHALRGALINALLEAERAEEALAHIRIGRAARDEPALAAAHANALHLLGDIEGAVRVLEEAAPQMAASPGFCIAFARQLIRAQRADAAAHYALSAAQAEPLNQEGWALLGIIWRLLNDPREHWLCDYERFVMIDQVEPPPGYASREDFVAALQAELTSLHRAQHAPLNQSLRGGTQTPGSLFGRRNLMIAAARDALRASVERMIAALPEDPGHPFLGRRAPSIHFSGSWSVRLRSAGRHVNHYHPRGWISSAFYIELPPSVARDTADRSGWIQFGQPPLQYETGLEPRRVIQPKIGRLVIFPSYMWHGTVPFSDDAHRMTMAFDAIPAKRAAR